MPLQDLVGLRQSYATAALIFLGGEVELEHFVLYGLGNAPTFVSDFSHDGIFIAANGDREHSAIRHSLHTIQYNVQYCLLDEIDIDLHRNRL